MSTWWNRKKITDIQNTLKSQIIEKNKFRKIEQDEKKKFDLIVKTSVENDKRENERIRLERQRKTIREKELRDEQLYLEHKKKAMYMEEKKNYEVSLVS